MGKKNQTQRHEIFCCFLKKNSLLYYIIIFEMVTDSLFKPNLNVYEMNYLPIIIYLQQNIHRIVYYA